MKKCLIALVIALALVMTAVSAFADGLVLNNTLQFFQSNEATTIAPSHSATDAPTDQPAEYPSLAPVIEEEKATNPQKTPYGQRIFDGANLFSAKEEARLNEQIAAFQKEHKMDFVVVTYNGPLKKKSAEDEADVFYEDGCRNGVLGNVEPAGDDENSGMLLYINPYTGDYHVSTTGKMIDYITDDRANDLDAELRSGLRSARQTNNYASCAASLLSSTSRFVKAGIPEGQYQYDVLTGERLTARHKALTSGEIILGGIIGLVVCLVYANKIKAEYNLKHNTYSYSRSENARVSLKRNVDQYLRSSVSRTRRSSDSNKGSGGFGGGSGSGVHVSSGGGSHGGFGGKF